MALINGKSHIGPEGKVLIDGLQWHDVGTDVSWDTQIITADDYPINHVDKRVTHISRTTNLTIESRHVLGDTVSKEVIDEWGDSTTELHDIIISQSGLRVGDSCEVHRVVPDGRAVSVVKDDLTNSTLTAVSSGLSFSGTIDTSNLGSGVYALTSDYAAGSFSGLVRHTHTSSDTSKLFTLNDSDNDDSDKNKMVIFAVVQAVSGLTDLTTDTTAKLVMFQSPVLAEDHDDYVAPVDLTDEITLSTSFFKTALVLDTPSTELNKIGLEVDFGNLPVGTTNYNVELRVGVSAFYAKALDVS